jgi:catechol 2,3-dioxygenase-like lactoylglutathione lyase family enzyme
MFWNKKIFEPSEGIVVEVVDVEEARRWYSEKLGLSYSSKDVAEEEATIVLGYSERDDPVIYLCAVDGNQRADAQPGRPPILFAKKVESAHEYLSGRGVAVGPLQSDSGGNRFFRFTDLEGNEMEVCQDS